MLQIINALIAVLILKLTLAYAPIDVLFLIRSQNTSYHRQLSENLRNDIIRQSHLMTQPYIIDVQLMHDVLKQPGYWTILNVLPHLWTLTSNERSVAAAMTTTAAETHNKNDHNAVIYDKLKWIIFCEESTHVELSELMKKLSQENYTEEYYLGYPLYDYEATIIHHFAFFENPSWFPYPMLRSGVIFTAALLKRMSTLMLTAAARAAAGDGGSNKYLRRSEFAIDAAHELARFILDNVQVDAGEKRLQYSSAGSGINKGPQQQQQQQLHQVEAQQRNNIQSDNDDDSNEKILLHSHSHIVAQKQRQQKQQQQQHHHTKVAQKMLLKRASYICPAAFVSSSATHKDKESVCSMHAKPMDTSTCHQVKRENIYFAIKTCEKYHSERIPIIEATWAPFAVHKRYFSDVADLTIPTISVGIANTETGHCAKTLAILKLALKDIQQINEESKHNNINHSDNFIKWLLLIDDDTLLSVSGICEIMGCFDSQKKIYLGERYGYRLHAADGFNYITGGGGIAMSLPVVRQLVEHCTCPSPTAPDDMILGSCLHSLQVLAIHSSRFHQARPNDYPLPLLTLESPVSFHKFWQLDPTAVYAKWFAAADREMLRLEWLQQQKQKKFKLQHANNKSQRSLKPTTIHAKRKMSTEMSFTSPKFGVMPFAELADFYHSKEDL